MKRNKRSKRPSFLGFEKDTSKVEVLYDPDSSLSFSGREDAIYYGNSVVVHDRSPVSASSKLTKRTNYDTRDWFIHKPVGYLVGSSLPLAGSRAAHEVWFYARQSVYDQIYIDARDLLFVKLNTKLNSFGMNLAQINKTAASLITIFTLISAMLNAIERRDWRRFTRAYTKAYSLIGNLDSRNNARYKKRISKVRLKEREYRKTVGEATSDQWLNFSFGLMPLFIDLQNLFDKMMEGEKYNSPREYASVVMEKTFELDMFGLNGDRAAGTKPVYGVVKLRLQQELKRTKPGLAFLRTLGLTNLALVIDDLIKLSFVVDYFTNHTKWLAELDEDLGVEYTTWSESWEVIGILNGEADIRHWEYTYKRAENRLMTGSYHKYVRTVHRGKVPAPSLASRFSTNPFSNWMRTLNQLGVAYALTMSKKDQEARRARIRADASIDRLRREREVFQEAQARSKRREGSRKFTATRKSAKSELADLLKIAKKVVK